LTEKHSVKLKLDGTPQGSIVKGVLMSDSWLDNNEVDHEEKVKISESKLDSIDSVLELPACSLTTLKWENK